MEDKKSSIVVLKSAKSVAQNMETLTRTIADINDCMQQEIFINYQTFMTHVASIRTLDSIFATMTENLQLLLSIVDKLRSEINQHYEKLVKKMQTLENLHKTSDALRKLVQEQERH